jgi:GNAT superfamily N-acetyltransferase
VIYLPHTTGLRDEARSRLTELKERDEAQMSNPSTAIRIRRSEPGDAGYVAYMHGRYYCKHHGFAAASEYYFIKHLADFVHDPEGGGLWIAEADGNVVGSVAIVRVDRNTAQFRWFLVDENYQNMGIGSRLMKTALGFCRENHYSNAFLWTFKGLDPARHLYDKAGFVLTEEKPNNEWSSVEITEQKMVLTL